MYDGEAWIDAGGGGGVSEEYVDTKVQEEATARRNADNEIRKSIPTKTSELENDSGFLTEHQSLSGYYTKTETDTKVQEEATARENADDSIRKSIPTKTSELENDSGFLTEHQSLSGYYTKTETDSKVQEEATARRNADDEIRKSIPAKTSQLTNDSGFLTKTDTIDHAISADTAATATAANTANSVQWSGVQGKPDLALKSEIPSKTSQLTNDSGFLTKSGTIDNAISAETATAANTANSVQWNGVQGKPVASATELGLVKVGSNLSVDADGTLNASGGGGLQPSDVVWTANNILQYKFGSGLDYKSVPISAEQTVTFVKMKVGGRDYGPAVVGTELTSQFDMTMNLDENYILNPKKSSSGIDIKNMFLQVVDMRNYSGASDERLSVSFDRNIGGPEIVQLNGGVQTVPVPSLATSYKIIGPNNNFKVQYRKYFESDSNYATYDNRLTGENFQPACAVYSLIQQSVDHAISADIAIAANTANTANTANSVQWSGVKNAPTTLTGYGITDAATKAEFDSLASIVGTANAQLEEIA